MKNERTNNQTKQERAAALLRDLSSAYQENAIESTAEDLNDYKNAQSFADDCCEQYRENLKAAGYGGELVYKGFRLFGDECQVQAAALTYYEIMNEKEPQKEGTTRAQDRNIITLIKKHAPRLKVCGNHYPHYSQKMGKWSAAFEVVKLENTKPQTINKHANPKALNYLFFFMSKANIWADPLKVARWNGTRAKALKVNGCRFIGGTWREADAEKERKTCRACFLVSVPALYNEQDQEKQEQRRNNRPNPTTAQRIGDATPYTEEEHTQKGERYEKRRETWGNVRRDVLDASGYNLTESRARLHQRAQELKKARELEKWNNTDHAETVRELRTYAEELKRAAVDIFLSSADFYPQHMAKDLRECADYIETTADQIENKTAENAEKIAHRVEHSRELLKKCRILRPLAADPRAYGWTWWELTAGGELVNTYKENKSSRDYYDRITADSVGIMEEPTQGASL